MKLTESKLRTIIREEARRLLEYGDADESTLSKVDRVPETALELQSPSAPPKVGGGKFYKTGSQYVFSTMKYEKVFDSIKKASKWFKANDWTVQGEMRAPNY